MSVYNEPVNWLSKSIDSILKQSYHDFEFIIINDNPSQEEIKSFLTSISEIDKRIIIIENPKNIGLAASLNKGIEIARGNYIARMDADDISLPTRFMKQINFLEKNPNIGICGSFVRTINEKDIRKKKLTLQQSNIDLKNAILFFCPFVHPSVMIRRELLIENKYDTNCRVAQDWDLWKTLSTKTDFANIPEVLLLYRIHSNQAPKKAGKAKALESRRYFASKDVKALQLPTNIASLYVSNSCHVRLPEKDLDTLYHYLTHIEKLNNSYKYIISKYIRKKIKFSFFRSIWNPLSKENPIMYFKACATELFRATIKF